MAKDSVSRGAILIAPTEKRREAVGRLMALGLLLIGLAACGRNRATPTPMPEPTSTSAIKSMPTLTATPTPGSTPAARVLPEQLYVRGGPNGEALPIGLVEQGATVTILGQRNGCEWLAIVTADGVSGWVMGQFVEPDVPCDQIAEAAILLDELPADELPAGNSTERTVVPGETATVAADEAPTVTADATAACTVAPPANWTPYRVVAGDTLSAIAARSGATLAQLAQVNCIVDGQIFAGQTLYAPPIAAPVNPPTATPVVATLAPANTPTFTPTGTPELRAPHTLTPTSASITETPTPWPTEAPPALGGSPTPTSTERALLGEQPQGAAAADAVSAPDLASPPTLTVTLGPIPIILTPMRPGPVVTVAVPAGVISEDNGN